MTDSLLWAAAWIYYVADVDEDYEDADLCEEINEYLEEKGISIALDGLADMGDGGLDVGFDADIAAWLSG